MVELLLPPARGGCDGDASFSLEMQPRGAASWLTLASGVRVRRAARRRTQDRVCHAGFAPRLGESPDA